MNQKQFSQLLGISVRVISKIENGNPIGLTVINKLEKTLGESKYTWS